MVLRCFVSPYVIIREGHFLFLSRSLLLPDDPNIGQEVHAGCAKSHTTDSGCRKGLFRGSFGRMLIRDYHRHLAKRIAVCISLFLLLASAAGSEEVDLELVLAMDGSGSISDAEYRLQLEGTAAAFLDPVIQAGVTSGPTGKIAVSIVVWADANFRKLNSGWHVLDSRQSVTEFAGFVRNFNITHTRKYAVGGGGGTGIGSGIGYALSMLDTNRYRGLRRVIDVSGDGIETEPYEDKFLMLPDARLLAASRNVQINGLPILTKKYPRLDDYYRNKVIHGDGSFIVVADGFEDFARAILHKLDQEITHRLASNETKQDRELAGLARR